MYEIQNFIKIYEKSFIENWDLPALTEYPTGHTLSYGDLAYHIALTHLFFESIGLKPGDKVVVCGKDSSACLYLRDGVGTYRAGGPAEGEGGDRAGEQECAPRISRS